MSIAARPVQPGQIAPDFQLPAVDRDGTVSLNDYRGKSPVLLALFRGLWCPFCRREIAQLGLVRDKLKAVGVEALGVVATTAENARLYFRYRPTRLPLAADAHLETHRAFGVPRPEATPAFMEELHHVKSDARGELPAPLPLEEAGAALDQIDKFTRTETDQRDLEAWTQLSGQFLIDRDGIVRWANIECMKDGIAGLGKFPTEAELLEAARALPK